MVFDSSAYGDAVRKILALDGGGCRPMPLAIGEGAPGETRSLLESASSDALFPHATAPAEAMAGLWLYFDVFEQSHRIAQDMKSNEAMYWHAILHRREPDPANSAYWFRRAGRHPVFEPLAAAAAALQRNKGLNLLALASGWNPMAFIDLVEEARDKPESDKERFAVEVQLIEWQLLFDHCARAAR